MASIFQKVFEQFKQNATSGNNSTTSVDQSSQPPTTTAVPSTTSTGSLSNTLTKDNSLDKIINQMKNLDTSVDTSAQQNFDVNKYLGGFKQGLQNLNGGQIQSGDVSKFTGMRTSEAQKKYEDATGRGLDKIEQFTDPNSDVYKTMFNRAFGNFDATAAATNMSQSMRIANNPYLTDSAKRVAGAELNRVTQSNRAALTGELTEQVNKMMFDAAKEFTTQSINAANYEEGKFKTDAGLALQEMSNRIQTLQLEGQLSITEAQMAYNQVNDTINNKYKDVTNQLEKLSLLATTAEKAQDYKLRAEQAYTQMFDFWAEHSVNSIIEMKNSSPDGNITLDQVKNDPRTMSYLMKEMEMNGYEGNVDDYIQSRIDSSKTQVQVDQEAVKSYEQSLINSGFTPQEAAETAQLYQLIKLGAIRNSDGSITIPGADGQPVYTIRKTTTTVTDQNGQQTTKDNYDIVEGSDEETDLYDNKIPTEKGATYTGKDGKLYQVGEDGKGVEILEGDYLVEGDILYTNVNGQKVKATLPSDDKLFGAEAKTILEKGRGTKLYDELISKQKSVVSAGTIPYKDLLNDPYMVEIAKEVAKPYVLDTKWDGHKRRFINTPAINEVFIYNGVAYVASSNRYMGTGKDEDQQYFEAIDLNTFQVIKIGSYKVAKKKDQEKNNSSYVPNSTTPTETPTKSNTENTTPKRNGGW